MYQRTRQNRCNNKKKVATPVFEDNIDVENAGVLLSLPALLSNGLLKHNRIFDFEEGYYSLHSILLTLSFCFLLRIGSIEKVSDKSPGELGKLIGLDRIPEVKTIRKKISVLSGNNQTNKWLAALSKDWMIEAPELAGVLYIDGHQDVYYGKNNKLPKRYISRMRLAMRATTDYWVNDRLGQPFFSISKHTNGSMIETIKQDIVPRLMQDVPNQPTEQMLLQDNLLHRFMLVYDRECYSPEFMIDMWKDRIACNTYSKYVGEQWSEDEFREYEIENEFGEKEAIKLAERIILLEGNETEPLPEAKTVYAFTKIELQKDEKSKMKTDEEIKIKSTRKRTQKKRKIWAREIRKLSESGHQTSIITTNYKLSIVLVGVYMFARWTQENYFKYMIKNFGLDMLISNYRQTISDTILLINPAWRKIDKKVRSTNSKLSRLESKFGTLIFEGEDGMDKKCLKKYNDKKAQIQEDISIYRTEVVELKQQRNKVPGKITFKELPDDEKFEGVHNEKKQLVDTIKMVVYRTETALSSIVRKYTKKPKESMALIAQFFKSNADIKVDNQNNRIYIYIHHQPTHRDDIALEALCDELNKTEIVFPQTNMKMVYMLSN